jgi:hypothetical protein
MAGERLKTVGGPGYQHQVMTAPGKLQRQSLADA